MWVKIKPIPPRNIPLRNWSLCLCVCLSVCVCLVKNQHIIHAVYGYVLLAHTHTKEQSDTNIYNDPLSLLPGLLTRYCFSLFCIFVH